MKDIKVPTVAITGMNARPDNPGPGLAVARSIREARGDSVRIIGLSYDVLDPGLYLSEFCDASYILPYPSAGEGQLLERLRYIQDIESIDSLIACLDAELMSFSRLRPDLEDIGIHMLLPDMVQLKERNKDRLGDLAKKAGVAYPQTKNITKADFFYKCQDEGWTYPMVVKGIFYDAAVVRNADEGASAFRKIAASWGYPVLVQDYVQGSEVNLSALGDGTGRMFGAVMMRKQAVTDKGKAWAGITVKDQKLKDYAQKIIKELKWAGPLEVEMLMDKNGKYQLIEINPRFPAWIYLSARAGCNLPNALLELIDGNTPDLQEPEAGLIFIRYAQETVITLKDFEAMAITGASSQNTENRGD